MAEAIVTRNACPHRAEIAHIPIIGKAEINSRVLLKSLGIERAGECQEFHERNGVRIVFRFAASNQIVDNLLERGIFWCRQRQVGPRNGDVTRRVGIAIGQRRLRFLEGVGIVHPFAGIDGVDQTFTLNIPPTEIKIQSREYSHDWIVRPWREVESERPLIRRFRTQGLTA